ncbi:hypothetical protein PISL3812_02024 [Talaromyces islandicus]|uniref:FAD-binding PCMH-type domain-containing protein n=1 Tax=Talaromyces islandicus TaxID=28573 RepID=A0A0U1LNQ2_TALIS|nr:hypothetical protein PISL3812_02024 [Talaromyces islandicus]
MMPFFANQSCDPYLPPKSPCRVGTYVRYAVRAKDAEDIQRTISFVKENNIRLVVRNTAHDYLGKSTGPGAVAVWTHHMKDIEVLEYSSSTYKGKAMRFAAGVQISEAMAAAHVQGLVIVAGNCGSVGIAGGYTQGGGHGQLASRFGLAADQVLEWQVLTAAGDLVRARAQGEHRDLYWALAGGGGGTYGVVVSMTVKAYPEMQTVAANLTFAAGRMSQKAFRRAVETFIVQIGPLLDARGASVWFFTRDWFTMTPASITGATKEDLQSILDPVIAELKNSNLTYSYHINEYPTFYEAYQAMNPEYNNISAFNMGNRFIPRSIIDLNPGTLTTRLWSIADAGAEISGISVNASIQPSSSFSPNSVNAAWRDAAISLTFGIPFSYTNWTLNLERQQLVTQTLLPRLEELTPGGGAYLNEADPHQPNWQRTFYGANYGRLLAIKARYDPDSIFYALTGVGSENWEQRDDGRLCRLFGPTPEK